MTYSSSGLLPLDAPVMTTEKRTLPPPPITHSLSVLQTPSQVFVKGLSAQIEAM